MKRRKSVRKTVERMLAFAALLEARSAKRGDLEATARDRLRQLGVRVEVWDCAITEIKRLESELERMSSNLPAGDAKTVGPCRS